MEVVRRMMKKYPRMDPVYLLCRLPLGTYDIKGISLLSADIPFGTVNGNRFDKTSVHKTHPFARLACQLHLSESVSGSLIRSMCVGTLDVVGERILFYEMLSDIHVRINCEDVGTCKRIIQQLIECYNARESILTGGEVVRTLTPPILERSIATPQFGELLRIMFAAFAKYIDAGCLPNTSMKKQKTQRFRVVDALMETVWRDVQGLLYNLDGKRVQYWEKAVGTACYSVIPITDLVRIVLSYMLKEWGKQQEGCEHSGFTD